MYRKNIKTHAMSPSFRLYPSNQKEYWSLLVEPVEKRGPIRTFAQKKIYELLVCQKHGKNKDFKNLEVNWKEK